MPITVLRNIAQAHADIFHLVDDVLENCPVLDSIPFCESTDGLDHKYETLTAVEGGGLKKQDAEPAKATAVSDLGMLTLGILAFTVEVGVDTLRRMYGTSDPQSGLAKYIAQRLPKFVRHNSMAFERQLMDLLVKYAVASGNAINAGGSGEGYAILATRWVEDEFCGLYNPAGFAQSGFFVARPRYAGGVYVSGGKEVVGMDYYCDIDVLLNNKHCIGAICNIDSTHKPTAAQIDEIALMARAGQDGRSLLIMHPKAGVMVRDIKGSLLHMTPADQNVNRSVRAWDVMPIVETYNFGDDGGLISNQTI